MTQKHSGKYGCFFSVPTTAYRNNFGKLPSESNGACDAPFAVCFSDLFQMPTGTNWSMNQNLDVHASACSSQSSTGATHAACCFSSLLIWILFYIFGYSQDISREWDAGKQEDSEHPHEPLYADLLKFHGGNLLQIPFSFVHEPSQLIVFIISNERRKRMGEGAFLKRRVKSLHPKKTHMKQTCFYPRVSARPFLAPHWLLKKGNPDTTPPANDHRTNNQRSV